MEAPCSLKKPSCLNRPPGIYAVFGGLFSIFSGRRHTRQYCILRSTSAEEWVYALVGGEHLARELHRQQHPLAGVACGMRLRSKASFGARECTAGVPLFGKSKSWIGVRIRVLLP